MPPSTQTKPKTETAAPSMFGRGGPGAWMQRPIERPKDVKVTILRLWNYLRQQKLSLSVTAIMVVANAGLNLMSPYLLSRAIDKCIIPHNIPGLVHISLLMLTIYILTTTFTFLQGFIMVGAAQRTVKKIRADLFNKLQILPLQFFDTRSHGDIMSRLTNDIENMNQVLSDSVAQIVSGLLTTVGVAAAMLYLNPILAVAAIGSLTTLTILLNKWVAKNTRQGFKQQQEYLGKLNGFIEETITGQKIVKAYGRETEVIGQFDDMNTVLRKASTRAQIFAGFVGPVMNFVNNSSLTVVAGIGGILVVRGMATVGTVAGFINYTRQFGRPLNEIAMLYNSLQSALAGAERVFAMIDETPEIDADAHGKAQELSGDVVFEDVTFSYEPDVPVLKHVNLHAKPGQVIALVGPTGAGKTTIVNLLTRFYEIDQGRILLDGVDIKEFQKIDLRRQLGIVLQDTFLFAGTVRENIRYGKLDATDEEVIEAAKTANAHQFIHRLPQGYDTVLSERGGNLSQGQRQLIAIARAILADPAILILDEATSSVDTRTEKHIQEAMRRLIHNRTSFVIAHRLSTIRDADQILVINHGEVIEQGTYQDLIDLKGFYYQLSTAHAGDADADAE